MMTVAKDQIKTEGDKRSWLTTKNRMRITKTQRNDHHDGDNTSSEHRPSDGRVSVMVGEMTPAVEDNI